MPDHRCEVHLYDGRVIDCTGLDAPAMFDRLEAAGVRPADIRETRHYLDQTVLDESVARAVARMRYEEATGKDWRTAPSDPGLDPKWRAAS